jgi:hypothetical protein
MLLFWAAQCAIFKQKSGAAITLPSTRQESALGKIEYIYTSEDEFHGRDAGF